MHSDRIVVTVTTLVTATQFLGLYTELIQESCAIAKMTARCAPLYLSCLFTEKWPILCRVGR